MRTSTTRRGISLIQLILLMPLVLTLLLMATTWIHQTMTFSSAIKKRQSQHLNLTRLASQFRRDVQQCQSITAVNGQQLRLQNANATEIQYTIDKQSVQFQLTSDGKLIQQDQFRLALGSDAAFHTSELPKWISLVVTRSPHINRRPSPEKTQMDDPTITELHVRSSPNRWGDSVSLNAAQAGGETK